jgi:RHS repeat-associated protein
VNEQRKFIGEVSDGNTGLSYLHARYYDGGRGQFVSQDPVFWEVGQTKDGKSVLTNPQALNSYAYANNNPITLSDPNGRVVETVLDVGFTTYDVGNTLYKGGQFIRSAFSGDLQKASNASSAFLGSFVDLGFDAGATLVPFLPAGLTKIDDAAKAINQVSKFDAVAQQQKMLKGFENSKAINLIKDVFRTSDSLPGGTMGALRNEIMTSAPTKGKFHFNKAQNTVNRVDNVLNSQSLNKLETKRLQGIRNSLDSLRKYEK